MNILTPVDDVSEVKLLHRLGANEFFCGYVSQKWLHKYNKCLNRDGVYTEMQISVNRRDWITDNILDFNKLIKLNKEVKDLGCKFYITFNYPFYPEEAYEELKEIFNDIIKIDIDGVIVTDIGLISFLHKNYPQIKIISSTCLSTSNSYHVKFLKSLGVKRITFPRYISLNEILEITEEVKDIEYEFFLMEGRCLYDDGNCKTMHSAGIFCTDQWDYRYFHDDNTKFTYEEIQGLFINEALFRKRTKLYAITDARENNWPFAGCDICSIPLLLSRKNITTLKLAGRGFSLYEKASMVKYVKGAITMAQEGKSSEELMNYGKNPFVISESCDKKCHSNLLL